MSTEKDTEDMFDLGFSKKNEVIEDTEDMFDLGFSNKTEIKKEQNIVKVKSKKKTDRIVKERKTQPQVIEVQNKELENKMNDIVVSVGEIKESVGEIKQNLGVIEEKFTDAPIPIDNKEISPKIEDIQLRIHKMSELDLATNETIDKIVNKSLTEGTKYVMTSINNVKDSFGQELESFAESFMKELINKIGSPKSAKDNYKEQIISSFIEMFHAKSQSKEENLWQVRNKAEIKEYIRVPRRDDHIFNRAFFELEEEGAIFIPKGEKKNRYLVSKEGLEQYKGMINEIFGSKEPENSDFYMFYENNLYDSDGNLLYNKISKFKKLEAKDTKKAKNKKERTKKLKGKNEIEQLNEGDLDIPENIEEQQIENVKNILTKKKKKK